MFRKVADADFLRGEHEVLRFWTDRRVFDALRTKNAGSPRKWSFLDGPITANNPMGVHHAWGRTYKDAFQRYFAMTGHELRYQNGFDCQGLWVEVEVEKELALGTKTAIHEYGIDRFVRECKKRVLRFAARQTEQSVRLGYWMEWDDPAELRKLAGHLDSDAVVELRTPKAGTVRGKAEELVARLGNPAWGGSYFTFSTENNETIWTFLKKCFQRGKIRLGHDVMPWSGRAGSAYSQMEIADGRKLTTHKSCFVRFPLLDHDDTQASGGRQPPGSSSSSSSSSGATGGSSASAPDSSPSTLDPRPSPHFLLVWTTTPWTLTSNVAAAVNPDLDYVKLRTKRDGAVYYFAKDNLDFKRLDKEFKEGFGRPEWSWPEGVPKLKTIGQIFKEQGGYEIEGTLKGSAMIGWRYAGPFDHLDAQRQPEGHTAREVGDGYGFGEYGFGTPSGSGYGTPEAAFAASSAGQHRVIDGGRDYKGNPNVVAGEGTGIVHIAPGCGDVDHVIGIELGLPIIAPLMEDGSFGPGFGEFTGRTAIDPATAELVFEDLRKRHLLVAVETYPHVYPHCWRTGDELVFRLVDEWFIDMDWRDEIKQVTKAITWLPESIQGQEREIEWLTTMRDWMISKKRFWGLALPIWVDEQTGDFEVIGSLAELEDRAVEGWDEFAGHTPHRPWIDRVKIRSAKSGNLMTRIPDVGNPWLDAGIVPFSTLGYREAPDLWRDWYPADFVTECFPGQFRNWFYSLLSLSTMMLWDDPERRDAPERKRPFKTLLGHRLVMDERGRPMHKSDGTAIWFEEAAEQLGVDTLRWLYLAQNPAQDLRFGLRHPDQPVVLETPDGPRDRTAEGLPTCRVTSTPADEIRRQVLIPLWNSYAFFVNYAILDQFDPRLPQVPPAERPEIDRWILSRLQELTAACHAGFKAFDTPAVCRAAAAFIDDLSNWYIRRNRRRFWRSRKESSGVSSSSPSTLDPRPSTSSWDPDKLAAYQTLYHVLVELTKLLAPCIPFLSERIYGNLVRSWDASAEESVHLCDYPEPDPRLFDKDLNDRAALAQTIVTLGHRLREEANQRVRQPLAELRYACGSPEQAAAVERLADVIRDELNVQTIVGQPNLDDLVKYAFKPNLKTLGPKYGKLLSLLREKLPQHDPAALAPLRRGEPVAIVLDGHEIALAPEDVLIATEQAADWVTASEGSLQIALSLVLTPELIREGTARDLVRQIQQLRKDAGLEIEDRIAVTFATDAPEVLRAVDEWRAYVAAETQAVRIERADPGEIAAAAAEVVVGTDRIRLEIERV